MISRLFGMKNFAAVLPILLLAACNMSLLSPSAIGLFQRTDVNLTQKNNAAADYLVQQVRTFIKPEDVIKVVPLADVDAPNMSAPISRSVPEQVGIRLIQLGYRTDITEVNTTENPADIHSSVAANGRPDFVLSGNYARKSSQMKISLRMTRASDGMIVGSFEYLLPITREISQQSKSETKIMRMPPPSSP